MRKPAIKSISSSVPPAVKDVLAPMKESLETIMGRRNSTVTPLATTASTAEIIAKINEILDLLQ